MPRGCPDVVLITAGFRATVAEVYGASTSTPRTADGFRSRNRLQGRVPGAMPRWPELRPLAVHVLSGRDAGHRPAADRVSKRWCSSAPSTGRDERVLDGCRSTTGLATRLRWIVANVFAFSATILNFVVIFLVYRCIILQYFWINNSLVDSRQQWKWLTTV